MKKKNKNVVETDKFIKKYNLPKLTKKKNLNNVTTIKGFKFVINFPQRKLQVQRPFLIF